MRASRGAIFFTTSAPGCGTVRVATMHYDQRRPDIAYQPTLAPAVRLERLGLGGKRLALGVAGLGGAWGPVDHGEARETLQRALEAGVGAFDVAPSYGRAEELLGGALATWRGARPVVSTKVGRTAGRDALEINYDYSSTGLRNSLERSLATLELAQVDLLFLHEPEYVPRDERPRVVDTLRQLQADGLARRLGIAGGDGPAWDVFLESGAFDVVMLFRRLDACVLVGAEAEVPRLRAAGVATYGASPLHMGLLGSRYDEFVDDRPPWIAAQAVARAQALREVAAGAGMSLPTLGHRFAFSLAEVDRVVIGARTVSELNGALADFAAGPLPREVFERVIAAG